MYPVIKCFRKNANAGTSQGMKDIFQISLHSSEAGKNAPVAGQVPKQGEGMFSH